MSTGKIPDPGLEEAWDEFKEASTPTPEQTIDEIIAMFDEVAAIRHRNETLEWFAYEIMNTGQNGKAFR